MSKPIISSVNSAIPAIDRPEAVRTWGDRRITAEERRTFLEDAATPDNLRRAFWLLAVYLPINVLAVVFNRIWIQDETLGFWAYLDMACSLTLFFLIYYLRRNLAAIPWKRHFLIAFYLYNVGVMEIYYFSALPRFGETSYYALGLLFLLASGDILVSGFFNGTNSLLLAALASWFLFHRDWETYEKGQMITRRNLELAEANARPNDVMAIAAHDLRSPLASLISYIDIVREEKEWQAEPYGGVLREWQGTLDDMLKLIGRMLHAHSAEGQMTSGAVQTILVGDLIHRSVARLQHSAQAKGIRLEVIVSEVIAIRTVTEILEQALDNLISNAVKFSPLDSQIAIMASRESSRCVITVQDEGPGIPAEEVGRLFSRFHRGRNQPTGGEATTGLGLFIVHQLMATLGGEVEYGPAQSKGAIFRLKVPIGH